MKRAMRRPADAIVAALILVFSFLVFQRAPNEQHGDSKYSMLLAENIVRYGDLDLKRYSLPDRDYRLRVVGPHRYYFFPAATSVLSIPFVVLMHLGRVSAVTAHGAYDPNGELRQDRHLAAVLMGGFAALTYLTARMVLPMGWSVLIATGTAFGTQVLSTTSRSMWSDTWGIVLTGLAAALILRSECSGSELNVPLVASLEGCAYLVRPTNAIALAATLAYVAITRRGSVQTFVLVAGAWLALLFAYSWTCFGRLLPEYFAANRLDFGDPVHAFWGNLVSPSRGLLVYVPAILSVALVLMHYRPTLSARPVAMLAGVIIAAHLTMLSGFRHWWGGHCYGARLTASLVPWFVILGILAADASRRASRPPMCADRFVAFAAATLLLLSVGVNWVGAFSLEASAWNYTPEDIDRNPARLWSWQRPQFLAPFVEPPGPFLELPSGGLAMGQPESVAYLGPGWGYAEGEFRWTVGRGGATLRFSPPVQGAGQLGLELRPYLVAGKVGEQRLVVEVNGRELANLSVRDPHFANYTVQVPAELSRKESILRLSVPTAQSPADVEGAPDHRVLGVAVRTIGWRPGETL